MKIKYHSFQNDFETDTANAVCSTFVVVLNVCVLVSNICAVCTFYIFFQKFIDCGYSLEPPHYVLEQK